jgi:hypothetical protein
MLRLPDGQPPDPAILVIAVSTRAIGDVITFGRGEQLRVVAFDDFPHAEVVEHLRRSFGRFADRQYLVAIARYERGVLR